ncbi:DUF560 domain-containing protein [Salmonella enterica subsp. enterica serovar Teko]|nr:DUF560 domain-containing protein [Salmonella enterica subsp. enterica serovar Teko]
MNETLIYFPSSRQYISAGLGYSMLRTKEKDSSFDKTTFRTGWMYEWNGGISTLLQAAYGYKTYLDGDFWGIKQINHEFCGTRVVKPSGFTALCKPIRIKPI